MIKLTGKLQHDLALNTAQDRQNATRVIFEAAKEIMPVIRCQIVYNTLTNLASLKTIYLFIILAWNPPKFLQHRRTSTPQIASASNHLYFAKFRFILSNMPSTFIVSISG